MSAIESSESPRRQLDWMHQMLDLWVGLGALACRTSVLVVDNITIEDQSTVCLERLIRDRPLKRSAPPSTPPAASFDLTQPHTPLPALAKPKADVRELVQIWKTLDRSWTEGSDSLQAEDQTLSPPRPESSRPLPLTTIFAEIDRTPNLSVDRLRHILDKHYYDTSFDPRLISASIDPQLTDSTLARSSSATQKNAEDDAEVTADLSTSATLPQVSYAAITDVGLQRSHNEDTFAIWERRDHQIDPDRDRESIRGLYVLCDGMGGHASGEIASQLATQTLIDFFQSQWLGAMPDAAMIRDGIIAANRAVYDINHRDHAQGFGRMGTTLVALWLHNTHAMIAHVGDSRIYRYTRSGGLEQLTIDHDVAQESIRSGLSPSRAYRLPNASRLTQAIGPHDETEIEPEIQTVAIEENTLFLLASDGLTDNNILERRDAPPFDPLLDPQTNLDDATTALIDFANRENGHDNTTIVLVRVLVD
jgi:protein phosphatase